MPSQHLLLEIQSIFRFSANWRYSRTSFQVLHLHSWILQTLLGWRPESEMTFHKHQTLCQMLLSSSPEARHHEHSVLEGRSTSSFTLKETAPTKCLQHPSSIFSALRIPVNSPVRYETSHWFGFSSCCVILTSCTSVLPAASSLSPKTALAGHTDLRDREVGML